MTWSLPHAEGSPRASRRPTTPPSPFTTLSNPQGANLRGPAASSNSSYASCGQPLCGSRPSTPARHIRSYPFWVKLSGYEAEIFCIYATPVEVWFPRFTHITGILGNSIIHGGDEDAGSPWSAKNLGFCRYPTPVRPSRQEQHGAGDAPTLQ